MLKPIASGMEHAIFDLQAHDSQKEREATGDEEDLGGRDNDPSAVDHIRKNNVHITNKFFIKLLTHQDQTPVTWSP